MTETTGPAKPFSYGQQQGERSLEATLKSWESVPLFMSGEGETDGSDAAIEAIQALAFDGTPDQVALSFKSQANEYFVAKRYREALGFYTQAIEANPPDQQLLETLHANRAACHLELANYGSCLRDTSAALGLNPKNQKAFYRAARALLALDKCVEAIDCCEHALLLDAQNQAARNLRTKAQARLDHLTQAQQAKAEQAIRNQQMQTALKQAFLNRGLWLQTTPRPPDNPTPAHFDPDSLPTTTGTWMPPDPIRTPLIFPVFFMYPQYAQSDFVSDYHEDTPIGEYLETIFPLSARGTLPWDTKAEYYAENVQVYATTKSQRLLKIGKKNTLRQIIDQAYKDAPPTGDKIRDRDGLIMQDGIISLIVLPKGQAETTWIAEYKKQRDSPK